MRNYTNEEDFDKNDHSGYENDFETAQGDGAEQEHSSHSRMVNGQNFDCRVNPGDENGIFTENGIDEGNGIFSVNADDDENEHFSEGASESGDGQSDEDGRSDVATTQADYCKFSD